MNNIEKLKEILKSVDSSSAEKFKARLETIAKDIDNLLTLDNDIIRSLNIYLADNEKLTDNELKFLDNFSSLSQISKKYLVHTIKEEETKILDAIKIKILNSVKIYDSTISNSIDVKALLKKFKNTNTSFITDDEVEFIIDNIKDKLDVASQIEILKEINFINMRVFNKYNIPIDDTTLIEEDSLNVTNVDINSIKEIFSKYGIDLEKFSSELKQRLSMYGDLQKIEKIINLLIEEDVLSIALKNLEIFVKTLIYSSVDMINKTKLVNVDIPFKELVSTLPTVLYPPVREKKKNRRPGNPPGDFPELGISGSMINYEKNSRLLIQNDIKPSDVWKSCPSFFCSGNKAVNHNLMGLKTYGISLKDENGNPKTIFSALGYRRPSMIDMYDIALESGAKDYALFNPSLLSGSDIYKFDMIKLAKKLEIDDKDIFGTYTTNSKKTYLRRKTLTEYYKLPTDIDKINKSYDTVVVNIPNKSIYDNIFAISNLNIILDDVLEDRNIKALDKFSDIDDTYNFNGTKISKRKVLRYYGALLNNGKAISMDSIIYCIIVNSMLDEKEFNNIYNIVKSATLFEPDDNIRIIKTKSDNIGSSIGGKGGN